VFNLLAQIEPLRPEMLKQIQEPDPIEKPPDKLKVRPVAGRTAANDLEPSPKAGPTDLETLKRIQELDPIQQPEPAKTADGD
jgi:hypothetical protein